MPRAWTICLRLLLLLWASHAQDMKAVYNLHDDTFDNLTAVGRWVVLFFCPTCGPCLQLLEPLADVSASHDLLGLIQLRIGILDCTRYAATCHQHDVRGYPSIRWHVAPGSEWNELPNAKGHLAGLKLYIQKLLRPELYIQQVSRREQLLAFAGMDSGGTCLVLMLPVTQSSSKATPEPPNGELSVAEAQELFTECYRRGAGYPLLYFAVCRSTDLLGEYTGQLSSPRIALFKDDTHLTYGGPLDADNVSQWMDINRFSVVVNLNELLSFVMRAKNRSVAILAFDSRKEKSPSMTIRSGGLAQSLYLAANDTALQERFIFAKADLADKGLKKWLRPALDPVTDKSQGRQTLPTFVVYDPHRSWVWRNDAVVDQMRILAWRDESCEHIIRRFLYRIIDGDEPPQLVGITGILAFIIYMVKQAPTWLLVLGTIIMFFVALVLPLALILNCVLDVLEHRARQRLAMRMAAFTDQQPTPEKVVWVKCKDKQS